MGSRGPLASPFGVRESRRRRRDKGSGLGVHIPRASKPDYVRADAEASAFWDRTAPALTRQGRLDALSEGLFAVMCQLQGLQQRLQAKLAEQGETITVGKRQKPNPLLLTLGRVQKQTLEFAKSFGMTPDGDRRVPKRAQNGAKGAETDIFRGNSWAQFADDQ